MPETKKASCLFCSLQCGYAVETDAGAVHLGAHLSE